MAAEETVLVLVKPDAVADSNVGKIISKLEEMGLDLVEMRVLSIPQELAEEFYKEAPLPKPEDSDGWVDARVEHLMSGPSVAVIVRGRGASSVLSAMLGNEDPKAARNGSLRKKFGKTVVANAVHGSASAEAGKREIAIIFDGFEP